MQNKDKDVEMGWLYYCGLSDMDVNNLNNVNLNNKRKRDFQKNNVSNFELDDDYESSWTKYVGIDRETREKLKKNQMSKIKEQIANSNKQNEDYYLRDNSYKDILTDEMIKKKIESLKPKNKEEDNFLTNNDTPIFSVKSGRNNKNNKNNNNNNDNNNNNENNNNSNNLNFNNNDDSTESEGNNQKNFDITNKNVNAQIQEENIEIPIKNVDFNLEKENKKENNNVEDNDMKKNNIQDNTNINQDNVQLNENLMSTQKKNSFPLSSYRSIQIFTQSPIQQNMNNQIEKNQIFQVSSMRKMKNEKKNDIINQKTENQNFNYFNKIETPTIMNSLNELNLSQNSPINLYKGLTQTPSLFSNHSDLIKDDLPQFKLDNFSPILNNDMSITNNEIKETYLRKNLISPILNQNNSIINNNNINVISNNNKNMNNNNTNNTKQLNDQNNVNENEDENIESNNPYKSKIIISKKDGKIVIKSIPNNHQEIE